MVKGNLKFSRLLCAYLLFTVVCLRYHMSQYMSLLQYKLAALLLTFLNGNPKFKLQPYWIANFPWIFSQDLHQVEFTIDCMYNTETAVHLQHGSSCTSVWVTSRGPMVRISLRRIQMFTYDEQLAHSSSMDWFRKIVPHGINMLP